MTIFLGVLVWSLAGPFLFMLGSGKGLVRTSRSWFWNDFLLILFCGPIVWSIALGVLIYVMKRPRGR